MWAEIFEVMFFGGFDAAWLTNEIGRNIWTDVMAIGALGVVLFIINGGVKTYRTHR